jgi:hypothetical protein
VSSPRARAGTHQEAQVPTYERIDDAGVVVERSVTFAGTEHDVQLSHAAANQDSPWRCVDALPGLMPVFVEPSTPDGGGDDQQDEQNDDQSDDKSDDTEE